MDPFAQSSGIGFGLGSLGAGLGQFFNSGSNPYSNAMPYFNQIPKKMQPYYQPYIDAGRGALNTLQGQYGNLLNNPGGVMNQIGSGYQQSPGYQWQLGQGMQAAGNAAASGGMAGSPQHQQQAATMAEGLANQDYYNYLNQARKSGAKMPKKKK